MPETRNGYVGFGYWRACPYPVRIAWGARAIIERDGTFDLLFDRADWNGDKSDFRPDRIQFADLVNLAMPVIRETVTSLMRNGEMRMDEEREFVLLDEDKLKVVGNTNGSYGYLYLVAFPKD